MHQPLSMSSLELSVGGLGSPVSALGPSLDLDPFSGGGGSSSFQLPAPVSEMERPMMAEMATRAMDELIRLAQAGEHLWAKAAGGREVLNVDTYDSVFAKPGSSAFRGPDVHVEGSRDSCLVLCSAVGLVDVFMDSVSHVSLHFRYASIGRGYHCVTYDGHCCYNAEQVDGVLPYHRVHGAHGGRPRERHGWPERVAGAGKTKPPCASLFCRAVD
jgi:hypothetical protein